MYIIIQIRRVRHITRAYIIGLQILLVPSTTIQCVHKHTSTDSDTWKYSTVHNHNVSFSKSAKQLQCYFNWCIHRNPFYSRYDTPTTELVLVLHALLILIPPKNAGTGLILMPVFGAALLYT